MLDNGNFGKILSSQLHCNFNLADPNFLTFVKSMKRLWMEDTFSSKFSASGDRTGF
jgi:hypothetical protein